MKTMLRRIWVLFLGVSLLGPSMVACWVVGFQKHQIRKEVKHQLGARADKADLQLLTFSHAEAKNRLYWEHQDEFEYRGEMYDVVERVEHGDSVSFWCWHDHEESELNQTLREMVGRGMAQDKTCRNVQESVSRLFQTLITPDLPDFDQHLSLKKTHVIRLKGTAVASESQTPPSPPPDGMTMPRMLM